MKTIQQVMRLAINSLAEVGVENPNLDTELLTQQAFGYSRLDILNDPNRFITPYQEELFFALLEKRIQRMPISQIIGEREFWDLSFTVNGRVLDPRPDSETIISAVFNHYKNHKLHLKIADYGTGSGCLLITLISHYRNALGFAFEKSLKACHIAKCNINRHNLGGRVKLYPTSWIFCHQKCDIIISNPPYIRRTTIQNLQPEIKKHEPKIALDGGVNGMKCYLEIFSTIRRCLKKNGLAFLEIGQDQQKIHTILPRFRLKHLSYHKDLSGQPRCIVIKHDQSKQVLDIES